MGKQPEHILEENLVQQLTTLGYERVNITTEEELLVNLKKQLEKHNKIQLSEKEFAQILNHLNKGNIFDRAKTLRTKLDYQKDNGEVGYLELLQLEHWCQNQFQVTHQVRMEGSYKNRYDVTLLINGLPLVQIELKKRGLRLKEAFNQIIRYQKHSFWASNGLFQYVQLFVISNGVNTKYYANNYTRHYKQTFTWADENNKKINQLSAFADAFLEKCHLSKMVCKYIVLAEKDKTLMVLRPYQYYAVEAIIDKVKNSNHNGYVWHTTGSGKTLTSFKASQLLMKIPEVHKVVFVVDRKDLDYQTTKEFNSFSEGSIDGTDNTKALVKQFGDDTKLIVTTIQKLNNAIHNKRYLTSMEKSKDRKMVFIFDECHRSQFGETHKRITSFFSDIQLFGFTGTPIFAKNAVKNQLGKRTTQELFGKCLHKYVIQDAINDQNVLRFSIEYVGKYKHKTDSANYVDIEVEDIDTKELLESDTRLEKIADYLIAHYNRKTHNGKFNAMFCVSGVPILIKYYELLKKAKAAGKHDLKIATIFSYVANEDHDEESGEIPDELITSLPMAEEPSMKYGTHSRDKLEEFIADYNQLFNTKFHTKDSKTFYNYYNDISKRVKNQDIDLLLVVNMFLTGFDSKGLNTLFVDKKLKYHGLIQAFSRTNRTKGELKSQGNIVAFRNLKKATDEAISLFSNKEAKEVIIMKPYENYIEQFNEAVNKLMSIAPSLDSVDELPSEIEELEFIKAFRNLIRVKNLLSTFADFDFEDLEMEEQTFEDYKSKYLDLYDKAKSFKQKEKVSILNDVDFELELIHKDEINVAYILQLLRKLKGAAKAEREKRKQEILDIVAGETQLRSKRELIEKFIEENLLKIKDPDNIASEFERFWDEQKKIKLNEVCETFNLYPDKLQTIIDNFLFTEKEPLSGDLLGTLKGAQPSLLKRKKLAQSILNEVMAFVETFIDEI